MRSEPCGKGPNKLERPHVHFPRWLMETEAVEQCKCGEHPRRMLIGDLVRDFYERRKERAA